MQQAASDEGDEHRCSHAQCRGHGGIGTAEFERLAPRCGRQRMRERGPRVPEAAVVRDREGGVHRSSVDISEIN
ncbi:hypothetical protein YT1_5177 [Rhodococcus ruber]|nr:hypothetical protein YT1_5177 [Rhodococcus ruber]